MEPGSAMLRIGELSRRLGVSAHVLRAWERRYGLLQPERSSGGYRLYSEADEHRVRVMQAHLARGLSAAEAARATLRQTAAGPRAPEPRPAAGPRALSGVDRALAEAFERFDEPSAQAMLDLLLADFTPETVLRDVLLPYLHELGECWERGEVTVAQEHFASNVLRARIAALGRGWGQGRGPRALLACAPGELHDLPLLTFGVVLYRNGWRVSYLGADTPMPDLLRTATASPPQLIVLSAVDPGRFAGLEDDLLRLAGVAPLALGGHGADAATARAAGARLLTGDPVTEAERLSRAGDLT
ncbi:MerR family transcriptional regulator [Actinoallomurus sp. NBC_01490]|uniref:MerR family transcriptional regulator n=1 Tax=Actinoallomurus sp. NBC_01490 TaxID=2903557 RepID=UPI002E320FA1|nr:MerR family transcriptional regulator [Actinoallomurus sp. NBC_01490]